MMTQEVNKQNSKKRGMNFGTLRTMSVIFGVNGTCMSLLMRLLLVCANPLYPISISKQLANTCYCMGLLFVLDSSVWLSEIRLYGAKSNIFEERKVQHTMHVCFVARDAL